MTDTKMFTVVANHHDVGMDVTPIADMKEAVNLVAELNATPNVKDVIILFDGFPPYSARSKDDVAEFDRLMEAADQNIKARNEMLAQRLEEFK